MLVYLVNEADFKSNFNLLDNHTAVKNENTVERVSSDRTERTEETSTAQSRFHQRFHQRKRFERQVKRIIHRYNLKAEL